MPVTQSDIIAAITASGAAGRIVCLHSSLRSFGTVEGGADAVIDAFLSAGCTLFAPSFSYEYILPPDSSIKNNGWYYADGEIESNGRVFDPATTDISDDMGAIPRAMVRRPGRHRGRHPTNSFTALGPKAAEVIAGQTFDNVYAPFEAAMEERGVIIMAGVDLTKMTAIHYAEQLAGRRLFIRRALDENGDLVTLREGSCSEGFNALAPVLSELEVRVRAGESLWRVFPFYESVRACADAIRRSPAITHCDDVGCARCNDMMKGGPVI